MSASAAPTWRPAPERCILSRRRAVSGAVCGGDRSCGGEEFGFDDGGVEWAGQEETLGLVDVFVSEVVHLVGGFDAFGQGREPEVLTELHERGNERF